MSWNKVTQMTGGVPAGTQDYNAQNLHILAALLLAKQGILHLTEWTTLTVPAIAAGVSIMHGENLYTNENSDLAITDPGVANGRVYIKISDAGGGTLDVEFTNSAAGFSWNNAYQGFYNIGGDQLMPYVLYKTASGYHKYTTHELNNKFDITSRLEITDQVSIGVWNMDATALVLVTFSDIIAHLISVSSSNFNLHTIVLQAIIYGDVGGAYDGTWDLENGIIANGSGSISYLVATSSTQYVLQRCAAGWFDVPSFSNAVMNRGYVNHKYWI